MLQPSLLSAPSLNRAAASVTDSSGWPKKILIRALSENKYCYPDQNDRTSAYEALDVRAVDFGLSVAYDPREVRGLSSFASSEFQNVDGVTGR
jgi:hypothetical protein